MQCLILNFLFKFYESYLRGCVNKINYLDNGFPVAAKGEKVTSNNSSIPPMFSTKYLNFKQKMFKACFRTSSKYAFPAAIRFSCFSTADLMVGNTSSMSI